MKGTPGTRWPLGFLVVLGAALTTAGFPTWVAGAEVQACLSRTGPLGIGSNPAECPPGSRLDAISVRFGLAVQFPEGGGPLPTGRALASPLVLLKRVDQTSPRLFVDVATQRKLPSVLVVIYDLTDPARARRLFSILLDEVIISSFDGSAQEGRSASLGPVEQVSFAYGRITVRDDGSGETSCFDFQQYSTC